MSDYTILVEHQAAVFLGGPPLVKLATGEVATSEELGGAAMHTVVSGLGDQLAVDEFDAILKARNWVLTLKNKPRAVATACMPEPPLYDLDDILHLVATDVRQSFDMMEVVSRLVDGSKCQVFKELYGSKF